MKIVGLLFEEFLVQKYGSFKFFSSSLSENNCWDNSAEM